jgi:hypothetical protein
MKALKCLTFIVVIATSLALFKGTSQAANLTCKVSSVAWTDGNGGTTQIYCGGVWYYARGTGCVPTSLDGRKAYMTLAQAAFLSGKSLYLEFSTSPTGCENVLSYVRLVTP